MKLYYFVNSVRANRARQTYGSVYMWCLCWLNEYLYINLTICALIKWNVEPVSNKLYLFTVARRNRDAYNWINLQQTYKKNYSLVHPWNKIFYQSTLTNHANKRVLSLFDLFFTFVFTDYFLPNCFQYLKLFSVRHSQLKINQKINKFVF